ncbi:hypothetical protein DdX_05104 [Ditylenchus destructor]|uniref:Uncharacterized protein n=1 Tax=Ditylenchus destructor TaxID=166010 RepID=A0AAD4NDN5_9BILA|nr:hypothetical protein DdX_05104 [Ditylenchus destructor]
MDANERIELLPRTTIIHMSTYNWWEGVITNDISMVDERCSQPYPFTHLNTDPALNRISKYAEIVYGT